MQMGMVGENKDYNEIRDYEYSQFSNDYYSNKHRNVDGIDGDRAKTYAVTSSSSSPLSCSFPPDGAVGYIEHPVSKFDTLAGVAIKYGVEVADIKKMNGLVTDLQMFALKSLQIPLPGRHPPSPCLSNGAVTPGHSNTDQNSSHHLRCDLLDSFQSIKLSSSQKVSPAMSYLEGCYGFKSTENNATCEGLPLYRKEGSSHYLENDAREDSTSDKCNESFFRRRQKSEADFNSRTPETLLKEENSYVGGFLASKLKGLALRSKAASKSTPTADSEAAGGLNTAPSANSGLADSFFTVRKSLSTPSLQDQESITCSSIWPTSKWSLKPDLQQVLSTAVITRPIFDGFPKPISNWRNKTALD